MARNNSMGGCEPIAPTSGKGIKARISEIAHELSPEEYRAIVISLTKELSATTTSNTATFRAPATHDLVIEQIMGHVAMVDVLSEIKDITHGSDATKGLGTFANAPDVAGRLLMKAMNCRATLENTDRGQKIIDGAQLNLAAICALTGGRTLDWSENPHIVPAGETLSMDVTLIQTDAMVVGGATEYGIVLVGTLVRTSKS